jgi:hypothetical protein
MDYETGPPEIKAGFFRVSFVYDVADTIDLERIKTVLGEGVARAPLQLRREASTDYIQYPVAPLIVRAPDLAEPYATVRAKIFDYGVISLRMSIPFSGPWDAFARLTRSLRRDPRLELHAKQVLGGMLRDLGPALDDPHPPLVEDFFVFEIESFVEPVVSAELSGPWAPHIAQLMLGESRRLTIGEQDEALRVQFAYFDDDFVVVQWDSAFVYDRGDAAEAVQDIIEFANTQLVEFRTYDARLDAELDAIYALDAARPQGRFQRKRASRSADQLRYLLVDVLELTDRASNALKIIGDAYYARLYRGAARRLALADWQRQIDAKLASVSEMYRVFEDQSQRRRSDAMELIVILLIAFEGVIGLIALRH